MKITKILLVLAVLMLGTSIIMAQNKAASIFNPKLLPSDASYKYAWSKTIIPIGESTFSVKKLPTGNFLIKTTGLENTNVEVNGANLQPLKASRSIPINNKTYYISSSFTNKQIVVKANLPTGEQNATVPLVPNVYHNDALLMSLMAMDMSPGKIITFKHYNPSNSQIADYKVSVIGEEKVKVPAGTFDTYHLKLDYANGMSVHEAWYQKQQPHKLIKYINTEASTTAKLFK